MSYEQSYDIGVHSKFEVPSLDSSWLMDKKGHLK